MTRIDYSRFARDEVGTLGIRAGVERTPGTISATGQALYNTNDFRLGLDHRVFRTSGANGGTAQESRYTVSTQLAMAGGKVAYGRPVGSRFAIVSAHPTLKDARLSLTDGATRKNPLAKARTGRPALVALGAPYLTSRVRVDVDRLPAGYDIGPGGIPHEADPGGRLCDHGRVRGIAHDHGRCAGCSWAAIGPDGRDSHLAPMIRTWPRCWSSPTAMAALSSPG